EGVRHGAHHEVRLVGGHLALADAVHLDARTGRLAHGHLQLVVDGERHPEGVESGAQVRRRRGHAHRDAAAEEAHAEPVADVSRPRPRTSATSATSTATLVGCTSEPSAAVRAQPGSLRPWPVTVSTTRAPRGSAPASARSRRPATLAAEAGSTKMPTSLERMRCASRIFASLIAPK